MNTLKPDKQRQVVAALVEGNSIRSTSRMTGVAKGTILKLLVDLGRACIDYQDKNLRNLTCTKIQVDEIWGFVYAKEKTVLKKKSGPVPHGDVWTFTALDADSKLIVSWLTGKRDSAWATEFLKDVVSRVKNEIQLTSDGHKMYVEAVDEAFFGKKVDFSQLVKIYGAPVDAEKRYSPAECIGAEKHVIRGTPDYDKISTSYVERQNLNIRMGMRRFTRLTNGFSKKHYNLECSLGLYFMYYNFCRIHQTLRMTPAMKAGVTDRLWEIEDIIALLK